MIPLVYCSVPLTELAVPWAGYLDPAPATDVSRLSPESLLFGFVCCGFQEGRLPMLFSYQIAPAWRVRSNLTCARLAQYLAPSLGRSTRGVAHFLCQLIPAPFHSFLRSIQVVVHSIQCSTHSPYYSSREKAP